MYSISLSIEVNNVWNYTEDTWWLYQVYLQLQPIIISRYSTVILLTIYIWLLDIWISFYSTVVKCVHFQWIFSTEIYTYTKRYHHKIAYRDMLSLESRYSCQLFASFETTRNNRFPIVSANQVSNNLLMVWVANMDTISFVSQDCHIAIYGWIYIHVIFISNLVH